MTVTTTETRLSYDADGVTKNFPFPYKFFEANDLLVYTFDEATETSTLLVLNVDYTVTGAGLPNGGEVVTTVAPADALTLVIVNDPDIVQEFDYVNADDFPAESHEAALDRLTKICQRLSDRIDRCVSVEDASPEAPPTLADVEQISEEAQASADAAAASAAAAQATADQIEADATQTATDAANAAVASATADAVAAKDAAETAATNADASKTSAQTSATNAANSATAASTSAGTAQTAATNAANSATAADNSATAADVAKIVWRGLWSGATSYEVNDAVSLNGSSYIAKLAHTGASPPNPTYWDLMAAKGADGAAGSGAGDMLRANNLSDVLNPDLSLQNLNVENWYLAKAGTANPAAPGTAAPGSAVLFARQDHVHPTQDLSALAPLASPVFTGDPKAPTPATADDDTSIATTAFVKAQGYGAAVPPATAAPVMDGTAAVGVATKYAREDHVHPTDTSRAAASAIPVAATAAEYTANSAPTKMLTPGAAWSAAAPLAVGPVANYAPDFNAAIDHDWTINSATGALNNGTNLKVGQKGVIYIRQDGTGGRAITTWGSQFKFPGGTKPTLTTAASSVDAISYAVLSSSFIACTFNADFK